MPSNVLPQIEITLNDINRRIELHRLEIPALATYDAAIEWLARTTLAISESIQAGLSAFTTETEKKDFLRKLSRRVHPDKLNRDENTRLRTNLAPFVVAGEEFVLNAIPQTILNALSVEADAPRPWLPEYLTRLYNQIRNDYQRYPEPLRTYIHHFNEFMDEVDRSGLIFYTFDLIFPAALVLTLDVLVLSWVLFACVRLSLQFLYADEDQRTALNALFFSPWNTQSLALVVEILQDALTKPFPADASFMNMALLTLLRVCQVIVAPVFLTAAAGEWLFFSAFTSLYLAMVTVIQLGIALYINVPLYAMDLFDYAVRCMDSFMSTPEPVAPVVEPELNPVNPPIVTPTRVTVIAADSALSPVEFRLALFLAACGFVSAPVMIAPGIILLASLSLCLASNAPVSRANRQLGFFVAEPALPAANDPAVLYPTMNAID